jgi:hypothetical protein
MYEYCRPVSAIAVLTVNRRYRPPPLAPSAAPWPLSLSPNVSVPSVGQSISSSRIVLQPVGFS